MDQTYVFVDGAWLNQRYKTVATEFFDGNGQLDFAIIVEKLHGQRLFYYDCIDDEQSDSESEEEYKSRVALQKRYFELLDSVPRVHVRHGSLRGRKRRRGEPRQKEIDILLAVEMLEAAYYRQMTKAVLIAGDLDFRPVVEAVIRIGPRVDVYMTQQAGSIDLARAADSHQIITPHDFLEWSFHPPPIDKAELPGVGHGSLESLQENEHLQLKESGRLGNYDVHRFWNASCKRHNLMVCTDPGGRRNPNYSHARKDLTIRFAEFTHGEEIEWSQDQPVNGIRT